LRVVGDDLLAGLEPFRPGWTLQRTRFWDGARHAAGHVAAGRPDPVPVRTADDELEAVLDEYRLDPDRYRRLLDRSLLFALGAARAGRRGGYGCRLGLRGALAQRRG